MSDHAAQDHGPGAGDAHAEHTHHPNYVKIWGVLLVLLVISVLGPMIGIKAVTLITAFGIAVVKAYLVAKNFMHLDLAPKIVAYIVLTMLAFMALFFAGAAPDVMESHGSNWEKPSWMTGTAHPPEPGGAHDEGH
jgi:caa(3)-type oxidase subunit IV